MNVLIGADPEIFVRDTRNGQFVCAEGMVPGTKEAPFVVDKGALQVDGTALEFNIQPASTRIEFIGNVTHVMDILQRRVVADYPHFQLAPVPVADFDPISFASFSNVSKELGCTPDYDAWREGMNDPPEGDRPFRTGSGHIHIGWTNDVDISSNEHFNTCCRLVRQLDYFLGVPSLLWDGDHRRRNLYGKAGAFRPKSYGLEYRVLSNAWLRSDYLIGYVYDAARAAIDAYSKGEIYEETLGNLAQDIINNNETSWLDKYGQLTTYSLPHKDDYQ